MNDAQWEKSCQELIYREGELSVEKFNELWKKDCPNWADKCVLATPDKGPRTLTPQTQLTCTTVTPMDFSKPDKKGERSWIIFGRGFPGGVPTSNQQTTGDMK
jgi:hypothetical protein